MNRPCSALLSLVLMVQLPLLAAGPAAAEQAAEGTQVPVLSLEQALVQAQAQNRQLANAQLALGIAEDKAAEARSYRYPKLQVSALGGYLLAPLEFRFRKGAFGDYASVGSIPATDTVIETPRQFSLNGIAQLTQPLSQQYKINLLVKDAKVGRDIEREKLRAQSQSLRLRVKQCYYSLVQCEAALRAAEESLSFLREFERIIQSSLNEKAVLKADLLEAQAKVLEAEASVRQWADTRSTQKEQLNLLLGRDLASAFEVVPVQPPSEEETDLAQARSRALANRPDLRLAQLGLRHAELQHRVAKAAYIPDLSLSVSQARLSNNDVLPSSVSTAGILVQWDLFEGGRRRREVAAAGKSLQQARNSQLDTEAQILIDVGTRQRKLRQTRQLWQASELMLSAEKERLRTTQNAFRENLSLRKDLLQQSSAVELATSRQHQALLGLWSAIAEFENALGND